MSTVLPHSTSATDIDAPIDEVAVSLIVNGKTRHGRCEPRRLLVDFLREDLGLTGTHAGCEHGICGACTVLLDGQASRTCTLLAVQASGARIVTVEGLASGEQLHPLQQCFHEHHALQCGFCTPGMLMTAIDFLHTHANPDEGEVREAMSAAVCRCTGYTGIVNAVMAAAALGPMPLPAGALPE